jgi:hypothetical protein
MGALVAILVIAAVSAAYLVLSSRKDRRSDRDHRAVMAAMSPGPRIHEMTSVRPLPLRRNRMAQGSRTVAVASDDFAHVDTNYGTYAPDDVEAAVSGHADTQSHHVHPCAEAPAHHGVLDTSSCDVGHDAGGHHGD